MAKFSEAVGPYKFCQDDLTKWYVPPPLVNSWLYPKIPEKAVQNKLEYLSQYSFLWVGSLPSLQIPEKSFLRTNTLAYHQ
jgi:hypothetical protein